MRRIRRIRTLIAATTLLLGTLIVSVGAAAQARGEVARELLEPSCVRESDVAKLFPQDNVAARFGSLLGSLRATNLCPDVELPAGLSPIDKYHFSSIEISILDSANKSRNETAMKRTVRYEVKFVVRDPVAGRTFAKTKFTLTTDAGVTDVITDELGTLIFKDSIAHRWYESERYILKVVRIADGLGFTKLFLFAMNPWDPGGFTFGRDLRKVGKNQIATANLRPPSVSSEIIDARLKLVPQALAGADARKRPADGKVFQLNFIPRVQRPTMLTSNGLRTEPLRDGVYILRYAFGPARFADPSRSSIGALPLSGQRFVDVVNGRISTEIIFSGLNKTNAQGLSEIHVQLVPIKEELLFAAERNRAVSAARCETLIDRKSELFSPRFAGNFDPQNPGLEAAIYRQRE